MTVMRERLSAAIQSVRRPVPLTRMTIDGQRHRDTRVDLAIDLSGRRAIERVLVRLPVDAASSDTLVVTDRRGRGAPPDAAVATARAWLAGTGDALPRDRMGSERAGWVRVDFDDLPTTLTDVDLPARFFSGRPVIAVSAPAGDGAIGLWRSYAHPNSALRILTNPEAAVEPALAIDATYLLVGRASELRLATLARHPLTAELLAAWIGQLTTIDTGAEARGPWEDARVQRLIELLPAPDVLAPTVVKIQTPGGVPTARCLARWLGEALGCAVDVVDTDLVEDGGRDVATG